MNLELNVVMKNDGYFVDVNLLYVSVTHLRDLSISQQSLLRFINILAYDIVSIGKHLPTSILNPSTRRHVLEELICIDTAMVTSGFTADLNLQLLLFPRIFPCSGKRTCISAFLFGKAEMSN